MVARYRAAGFTASARYESTFQGTFVRVRRHGRDVVGGFADGRVRHDRRHPGRRGLRMSTEPIRIVEYLEPVVEAEALPDEFSPSSLRRSLLIVGAIVLG